MRTLGLATNGRPNDNTTPPWRGISIAFPVEGEVHDDAHLSDPEALRGTDGPHSRRIPRHAWSSLAGPGLRLATVSRGVSVRARRTNQGGAPLSGWQSLSTGRPRTAARITHKRNAVGVPSERPAVATTPGRRQAWGGWCGLTNQRDRQRRDRATPITRANRHGALLQLHEAFDDGQSEAGARLLRGVERIEDALHDVERNAGPSIAHDNVTRVAGDTSGHLYLLAAGLTGVEQKIEQRRAQHLRTCPGYESLRRTGNRRTRVSHRRLYTRDRIPDDES